MNRIFEAVIAATLAAAVAPASAQTFRFDKVEAETDVGSPWRSCYVNAALNGAYDVQCDDYRNRIVYDTRVRAPGGQPVAATAAQTPSEGAWKTGDLVLVSPTAMHNSWQLCSYVRPSGGGHEVMCAGRSAGVVGNDWIRVDQEFPTAAAPAADPAPAPAMPEANEAAEAPPPTEADPQADAPPAADAPAVTPPPPPPPPTLARLFRRSEKVEAETDLGRPWRSCHVNWVYDGAYDVQCDDYRNYIVYDTRVRAPGGRPAAFTEAYKPSEGAWKTADLVLVSPTAMHNNWQLCSYVRPRDGGHEVMCAGRSASFAGNDWIRVDPDFPPE